MAGGKEGSVAPQERVNLVIKAETGGAKEEQELPLKLLFTGDFTMRLDETPLEERKKIRIDQDSFDDVMKGQNVKLLMTVPNKLSGREGEEIKVTIPIDGMKAFSPDSIVQHVPELKTLLELRTALQSLKGPLANVPAFKKKINSLIEDPEARQRLRQELGIEELK